MNLKYVYKERGADLWDESYRKNSEVNKRFNNLMDTTIYDLKLSGLIKFNLLDIGCGNGLPAIEIMNRFLPQKYIAIDISETILEKADTNITKAFPDLKKFFYNVDIENGVFGNYFFNEKKELPNWVIFIDSNSTICNSDDRVRILKNFAIAMTDDDFLSVSFSLNTRTNRNILSYVDSRQFNNSEFLILQEMGVDVDNCEVSLFYNEKANCKMKTIKMDKEYHITLNLDNNNKRTLVLPKNKEIVVWKHYLLEIEDIINDFRKAGLKPTSIKTLGYQGIITGKINTDQQ